MPDRCGPSVPNSTGGGTDPDQAGHAPGRPVSAVGVPALGMGDRAFRTPGYTLDTGLGQPVARDARQVREPVAAARRREEASRFGIGTDEGRVDVFAHL